MKVLMISTDRLIFQTGAEVRRRMLDYGTLFEELQVIVLTRRSDGLKTERLTDNVVVIATNSQNRVLSILRAFLIGRDILKKNLGAWVITSQDPFETGLIACVLKKLFNHPWQAQVHTDLGNKNFRQESLLNFIRFIIAFVIIRQADGVRVVSLRIKEFLISIWKIEKPITVLPIFVARPTEMPAPEIANDLHHKYPNLSFIVLMASRLTREKNFGLALGALAETCSHRPGLGMVVVGSGPERKRLGGLIKAMALEDRVFFEDWTCNLGDFYQTADLFLLTSNYEGYGRTIIEAGLYGCPILSADIGLVGEIATDKEILICPVGDEVCLAEKIGWAVSHQRELGQMALKFKDKLSQNLLTRGKYLTLFRESLNL